MDISAEDRRRAFSHYLRTGRRLPVPAPDPIEYKFNPYHDPRNGQFTFAPGGSRSLSDVRVVPQRNAPAVGGRQTTGSRPAGRAESQQSGVPANMSQADAVYRPNDQSASPQQIASRSGPRRGSNIRPFQDPMTLQQVFPGLQNAPGGAIVALIDNVFDFSRPARELTTVLAQNMSNTLISQIKAIDPNYRFDSIGFPETFEGQMRQLDQLRFDRAAALFKIRGEIRSLQVETMRFMQDRADAAYAKGDALLNAGKLPIRLSPREALGNYIDREVRRDLRLRYARSGIDAAGQGPVRVNRRENDNSATDATFRRPDARVGQVALDVTLSPKTAKTPQVHGFFQTDFRPSHVIIVRPRQVDEIHTYIIPRTEMPK